MLLINQKTVTIDEIAKYKGSDEVMFMFKSAYDKIMRIGFPLTLKWAPGIRRINPKSGLSEGKRLIVLKKEETIKTKSGSVTVRWTDSFDMISQSYGDKNYQFKKLRILNESDIEEALFLVAISPVVKRGNIIVLEDIDAEAKAVADRRASEADVNYLIYGRDSNVTDERIIQLAYAWGVSGMATKGKSINAVKNALYDAVISKKNDATLNINAFIEMALSEDTPEFAECMSLIQQNIESGNLMWDARNFAWIIKGSDKKDDTVFMQIPPGDSARRIELIAKDLMGNKKKKALFGHGSKKADDGGNGDGNPGNNKDENGPVTDEELKEYFCGLSKAKWNALDERVFAKAVEMAGLDPAEPPAVLVTKLLTHYKI